MLTPPKFTVGQKVIRKKALPWNKDLYLIISVEPVTQNRPFFKILKKPFRQTSEPVKITDYRYRCKSSYEMRDFKQNDLAKPSLKEE